MLIEKVFGEFSTHNIVCMVCLAFVFRFHLDEFHLSTTAVMG